MAEAIDLSQLGKKQEVPTDINGLSEEERQRLEEMAAATPKEVITAFVVYQSPDGEWAATSDLDQVLDLHRGPTPDDITAGCAVVTRDIQVQITAVESAKLSTAGVIQNMMMISKQAAEAQQMAQVSQILQKGKR